MANPIDPTKPIPNLPVQDYNLGLRKATVSPAQGLHYDPTRGVVVNTINGTATPATMNNGSPLPLPRIAPHYDSDRGVVVDTNTGISRPVISQEGGPLQQKPSEKQRSEQLSINQQLSTIDGAIQAVKDTPGAFTMRRGLATMAGAIPESIAGRMDSSEERTARSYVFNIVSKVINERAGAAQSKQELARLRSFLPAETDAPEQIVDKLSGFKTYLSDLQKGNTTAPGAISGATPKKITNDSEYSALPAGALYIGPDGKQRRKQ
jgi:hypothetical protein